MIILQIYANFHWSSAPLLGDPGVGRDVDLGAGIGEGPGVGAGVEDGGQDQQVPVKAEKQRRGMVMYCFAYFSVRIAGGWQCRHNTQTIAHFD